MRRIIGPIMTTGVALVTAGVVVANPITAPHADVQVPAVRLSSGTDETGGMLDKAFLDAIGPSPSEPDNPFAVLKLLVTSLAADATSLGKNVIVDAFVAGVTAVSQPELTAASFPYVAPPADLPALIGPIAPGWDISALVPNPSAGAVPAPTAAGAGAFDPVAQEIISSLVADVGYVGDGLLSAAFAAGALVATEPKLIADTVKALLRGNFDAALAKAVNAVTAPLGPPTILFEALRNVVENHLAQVTGSAPAPVDQPAATTRATKTVAATSSIDSAAPAAELSAREIRRNHRDVVVRSLETPSVPGPAASLGVVAARSVATVSEATTTHRKPAGAAREAIKAIGDQVGAAVEGAADAVGKMAGRSRGAQTVDRG